MDILLLIIGVVLGVVGYAFVGYVSRRRRAGAAQLMGAPTNYDTRIDQVSESGLDRYRLHKAHADPRLRTAMKGTDLYMKAAPLLGWEE